MAQGPIEVLGTVEGSVVSLGSDVTVRPGGHVTGDALAVGGRVLAYCRSGNRSILTWAAGEAIAGAEPDELIAAGEAAGYNLRPLFG